MRFLASVIPIACIIGVSAVRAHAEAPQAAPQAEPAQAQPAQPAQPGAAQPAQPAQPGSAQPAQPGAAQPSGGEDKHVPSRSVVVHIPPSEAVGEQKLRLVAVVDAAWTEASLVVRYRAIGSTAEFSESPFERSSAGGYFATIPARAMKRPGVEYYIVGQRPDGTEILHFGSASVPHAITIAPTMSVRWAEKERRRLGGHTSAISVDVNGQNFGNRFGNPDRFARAELEFVHRMLAGPLYSISLGYGAIEGETPDREFADAISEEKGARYGYAGIRLKLSRSIWADGKASLGFDRNGFIVGAGFGVTLGRPWRSNVNFGAEYMGGMGPSLWFRLQWDTVPPFLMGATLYKTDLPGAVLAHGSFIIYDVSYAISPRITARLNVSFGSRDGPGSFGGGLGTSLAF